MRTAALALLGLAALTAACQRPPSPSPQATAIIDHAAEARKALGRQEWATAAPHLRAAIAKGSDELGLHYGLAICASWLDLRDEAVREFLWVLAHASSGSDEARVAREWLEALARRGVAGRDGTSQPAGGDAGKDDTVGTSGVHGRVVWDEGQGPMPLKRFQVHLYAMAGGVSKGMSFHVRTDQDGQYTFPRIPPGTYKLTDTNVVTPKWRMKIEVKEGEHLQVDLTPQNSVKTRDDFPRSS